MCGTDLFVEVGDEEDRGERQRGCGERAQRGGGGGERERAERWQPDAAHADAVGGRQPRAQA